MFLTPKQAISRIWECVVYSYRESDKCVYMSYLYCIIIGEVERICKHASGTLPI